MHQRCLDIGPLDHRKKNTFISMDTSSLKPVVHCNKRKQNKALIRWTNICTLIIMPAWCQPHTEWDFSTAHKLTQGTFLNAFALIKDEFRFQLQVAKTTRMLPCWVMIWYWKNIGSIWLIMYVLSKVNRFWQLMWMRMSKTSISVDGQRLRSSTWELKDDTFRIRFGVE